MFNIHLNVRILQGIVFIENSSYFFSRQMISFCYIQIQIFDKVYLTLLRIQEYTSYRAKIERIEYLQIES